MVGISPLVQLLPKKSLAPQKSAGSLELTPAKILQSMKTPWDKICSILGQTAPLRFHGSTETITKENPIIW